MSQITIEKAKEQIENAIDQNGGYSHNIIGLVLSQVAADHGVKTANELVEEFDLTNLYGIHPVSEEVKVEKTPVPQVKEKTREELRAEREAREAAERKAKRQVLVGKLVNLGNEIEALAPGYLKYKEVDQQWGDAEVYLEARSEKYDEVYARVVTKRGWSGWHENGKVYVRIETSDWDHQFKRNWTFDTKNLAKKVLEKVQTLIAEIEAKKEHRAAAEDTYQKAVDYLTQNYNINAKDLYRHGSQASGRLLIDEENYRSVDFVFDVTEKTFKLRDLPTLTEDQFQQIVAVVKVK